MQGLMRQSGAMRKVVIEQQLQFVAKLTLSATSPKQHRGVSFLMKWSFR